MKKKYNVKKIFSLIFVPTNIFWLEFPPNSELKFIYSEKAIKFCEISTLLLTYVVPVKSKVAFSEYMNFTSGIFKI